MNGQRRWYRFASMGLALALLFFLAGDRGATATIYGIDPLEVLDLQVKPNVIIVLDSSGSMAQNLDARWVSGDSNISKMGLAKPVLSGFVQANQNRAAFLFGQYTADGDGNTNPNRGLGNEDRFVYSLRSATAVTDVPFAANGFWVNNNNNDQLRFREGSTNRTADLGNGQGFATGANMAAQVDAQMTGAGGTYDVTYDAATDRFTIRRTDATTAFKLRFDPVNGGSSAANLLGFDNVDYDCDPSCTSVKEPDRQLDRQPNSNSFDTTYNRVRIYRGPNEQFQDPTLNGDWVYTLMTGRFYNGARIDVVDGADGVICTGSVVDGSDTNPATLTVRTVSSCGGSVLSSHLFTFEGAGDWTSSASCDGFIGRTQLFPCGTVGSVQLSQINPLLVPELRIDANGNIMGYTQDSSGNITNNPTYASGTAPIKAGGSTPIANSLDDIKALFETNIWPDISGTPTGTPKEKTVVLFVSDGDDTCPGSSGLNNNDDMALRAAYQAQLLYERVDGAESSSSVTTMFVAFGSGISATRSNWIAWGGSGLGQGQTGQPAVTTNGTGVNGYWDACAPGVASCSRTYTAADLQALRDQCPGCRDAFFASNAAELSAALQSAIEIGATEGDFSAQQSITESVFEYVKAVDPNDPLSPTTRFKGLVPTRFVSGFTLSTAGFRGKFQAIQNVSGAAVERWEAGSRLSDRVSAATFTAACGSSVCVFDDLHSGATVDNVISSGAAIKRRIYTTSGNGVYTYTAARLFDPRSPTSWPERTTLWPPAPAVHPNGLAQGQLDIPLGLPDDAADPVASFNQLQADFGACTGTPLLGDAANCASAVPLVQMQQARREAREMILAYIAGAAVQRTSGAPNRVPNVPIGNSDAGRILFRPRGFVLAESTLSTPALLGPPLPNVNLIPALGQDEYKLYRFGPRDAQEVNQAGVAGIIAGLGVTAPDADSNAPPAGNDSGPEKPIMTVVYLPTNEALHAFRAGPTTHNPASIPSCTPSATTECGGEELWAFVPYDQLGKLRRRLLNDPQPRDPHDYMIASAVRFAEVFVPGSVPTTIGGASITAAGVWRRLIYFGRGIGGKYLTALDVTAPGTFQELSLNTTGPIPVWSRGNPDTTDGTPTGPLNNTSPGQNVLNMGGTDFGAYAHMGQSWSVPAIAYAGNAASANRTARNPAGVSFVAYVGSGYSDVVGEGTTFFALDALTGDVIGAGDVGSRPIGAPPYSNALVADAAVFSIRYLQSSGPGVHSPHPAANAGTRIYMGDVHGRLFKFLAAQPGKAFSFADLNSDASLPNQPVGVATGLLGLPADSTSPQPYVYVTTGNDRRATGPFTNFAFLDNNTDDTLATDNGDAVEQFRRVFDAGPERNPGGFAGSTTFRGTAQPAAVLDRAVTPPVGRIFFVGTRFNPPNSTFAPPPGSGGRPCLSSFDSIVYVLGAKSGLAAYDLNSGAADDAYMILRDSRLSGVGPQADPGGAAGARIALDEGLVKGGPGSLPEPPPEAGVPPNAIDVTNNVGISIRANQPLPMLRYGSSVCSQ